MVRLFDADGYIQEFYADVLSCDVCAGGYGVVLDRTAFFPESGGQKGDTGNIGEACVSDTREIDGKIVHITDKPVSGTVFCRIDWLKRFRRMQNHTGEHIASGIICKRYGCNNVGFHLGDGLVTMDYDFPVPESDIAGLQAEANRVIWADLPVYTRFPANFAELTYRSKLDLKENVRIVEIPGVDVCACCAPHVRSTGEIGVLKIVNYEKNKGGVRLSLKCGEWALNEFEALEANAIRISALTSRPRLNAAEAVADLNKRLADALALERQLKLKLLALSVTDKRYVFVDDAAMLKDGANLLKEKLGGTVCAFAGNDTDGYRFMLLFDDEAVKSEFCTRLSAAGGGRNGMLQGLAHAKADEIINFF